MLQSLPGSRRGLTVTQICHGVTSGRLRGYTLVDFWLHTISDTTAGRGFTSGSQTVKHLVSSDATVVADWQCRGIDERDTGDRTQAGFQVETQGQSSAAGISSTKRL